MILDLLAGVVVAMAGLDLGGVVDMALGVVLFAAVWATVAEFARRIR